MVYAFDCFGVLVLTPQEYFEGLSSSVEQARAVEDLFLAKNFGLMSNDYFFDELSVNFEMPREEIVEIFKKGSMRNEEMFNFLKKKKHSGSKIAIVSNVAQYLFNDIFTSKEQTELFDEIILSEAVGAQKPNQRIFEISEEKFGVSKDEICFIDDIEENVIAAREFGWQAVLYKKFSDFEKEMELINA